MLINKLVFAKHLEKGEKILYAVHKHWIDIVKPITEIAIFGLILPWTLYLIGFNAPVFFWIAVAWSFMAYIRFMYELVDWYCDAWLITDMSVLVVEWKGIFNNMSARSGFEDIEGATYEIRGFWGTVLRYGNMELRLMSASNFKLERVASPKKVELALMKFQDKYLTERNMQDTSALKNLLADLVHHHSRRMQ